MNKTNIYCFCLIFLCSCISSKYYKNTNLYVQDDTKCFEISKYGSIILEEGNVDIPENYFLIKPNLSNDEILKPLKNSKNNTSNTNTSNTNMVDNNTDNSIINNDINKIKNNDLKINIYKNLKAIFMILLLVSLVLSIFKYLTKKLN